MINQQPEVTFEPSNDNVTKIWKKKCEENNKKKALLKK